MAEAAKRSVRKKKAKIPAYTPPDVRLNGLTVQELQDVKTMVLVSLCEEFDRPKAARKAGLGIKAFRLLLSQDEEFRQQVQAIKKADDDTIADMAKKNLRDGLIWRGEGGQVNNTLTVYANKVFGGYVENNITKPAASDKSKDPVDLEKYRKPLTVVDKVAMKPDVSRETLPPEENYEGENLPMKFKEN